MLSETRGEPFTQADKTRGILPACRLDMQGHIVLPQLGRHVAWSCRLHPQTGESLVRIEAYHRAEIRLSGAWHRHKWQRWVSRWVYDQPDRRGVVEVRAYSNEMGHPDPNAPSPALPYGQLTFQRGPYQRPKQGPQRQKGPEPGTK